MGRTEAAQRELLHRVMVKESLLPGRSQPNVLRGALRTFASSLRARYRPTRRYQAHAHLLLVDDPRVSADINRDEQAQLISRWRTWAPNMVDVHVSGNHFTMLQPPHVEQLAGIIRSAVSRGEREVRS